MEVSWHGRKWYSQLLCKLNWADYGTLFSNAGNPPRNAHSKICQNHPKPNLKFRRSWPWDWGLVNSSNTLVTNMEVNPHISPQFNVEVFIFLVFWDMINARGVFCSTVQRILLRVLGSWMHFFLNNVSCWRSWLGGKIARWVLTRLPFPSTFACLLTGLLALLLKIFFGLTSLSLPLHSSPFFYWQKLLMLRPRPCQEHCKTLRL